MNINGDIDFPGNLTLRASGASEIRNAYIERLSDIQEEAIAATLGVPHLGRVVFNTTVAGLKIWDGFVFKAVATDLTEVSSHITALRTAIGPIISGTTFAFDPLIAGELSNIGLVNPTSVFDIFKAIDTSISALKAPASPTNFNDLAGVVVLQPTDKQLLKYRALDNSWINDGISLSDIIDITATSTELNHMAGVTSDVQAQLTTLNSTITTQASEISALQEEVTRLNTPFTIAYTDATTVTVPHNRGIKYVNVIVVNAADITITPTQIVYNDANTLTVTLSASGTGTIIVS